MTKNPNSSKPLMCSFCFGRTASRGENWDFEPRQVGDIGWSSGFSAYEGFGAGIYGSSIIRTGFLGVYQALSLK